VSIRTSVTTVANVHKLKQEYPGWASDDHFEYIGRKKEGNHFGNPFSAREDSLAAVRVTTPEKSVIAFGEWLDGTAHQEVEPERRAWILENLYRLQGKTLVCFCHPRPCHGNVYVTRLD
jgi:hypothetical protein